MARAISGSVQTHRTHTHLFPSLSAMELNVYEVLVHSQPILGICRASRHKSLKGGHSSELRPQNTSLLCSFAWEILEGTWHSPCGRTAKPTASPLRLCHTKGLQSNTLWEPLGFLLFLGWEKDLCEKSSLNRHHLEPKTPASMPGQLSPSLGTSQVKL